MCRKYVLASKEVFFQRSIKAIIENSEFIYNIEKEIFISINVQIIWIFKIKIWNQNLFHFSACDAFNLL